MSRRLLPLVLLLLCVLAAPAAASPTQESTFQDDNQIVYGEPSEVPKTLDRLRDMGVDRLRISIFWAIVAPEPQSQAKPAFDATDPAAYPAANWERYDRIVKLARERGLGVNFNVTSPAPFWATGSLADRPDLDKNFDPNTKEFGAFVKAVATRYSGTYVPPAPPAGSPPPPSGGGTGIPGFPRQEESAPPPAPPAMAGTPLPRVDYWTVWNEPNQPGWLTPQWAQDPRSAGKLVEVAPRIYRSLVDEMFAALAETGHGNDTFLIGETAPKGAPTKRGTTRALKPARFIRQLYCLDDKLNRYQGTSAEIRGCPVNRPGEEFVAAHPGLFKNTGYAHHPYELTFKPSQKPRDPEDFTTANLGRLSDLLRRAYQRYGQKPPGGGRDLPLYLTEFGYQTNPPDPVGVSYAKQSAYLNEAEYLTWGNRNVRTLTQFLLVDDKGKAGAPNKVEEFGGTFQSGLLTENGAVKPALQAYQFPIHVPTRTIRRGRRLPVWGMVRPAGGASRPNVRVEVRDKGGKGFRRIRTVKGTKERGYVLTSLGVRRSGAVRLTWTGADKTFHSRSVSFRVK